jgi:hypothetical protein
MIISMLAQPCSPRQDDDGALVLKRGQNRTHSSMRDYQHRASHHLVNEMRRHEWDAGHVTGCLWRRSDLGKELDIRMRACPPINRRHKAIKGKLSAHSNENQSTPPQ